MAVEGVRAQLAQLTIQPILRKRIIDAQLGDPRLGKTLNELVIGQVDGYSKFFYGELLYQGHLCVPVVEELRNEILGEVHNSCLPCTLVVLRCIKT